MCCSNGLISRTDPHFTFLPIPSPPPTPRATVSFPAATATSPRFASFKTRATLNDGYVAEALPPLTDELSFYELLGIPETVTLGEIKQAYKQLAKKYHPDVSPPDRVEEYTQRFIRVQEAYETLSDPNRRALYDQDMAMGLHLAFSARNPFGSNQGMKGKYEWRSRWQSQLSQLKRRSEHKETTNKMSWGARMRRQRAESSTSNNQ